jgi:hypothetical protein
MQYSLIKRIFMWKLIGKKSYENFGKKCREGFPSILLCSKSSISESESLRGTFYNVCSIMQ